MALTLLGAAAAAAAIAALILALGGIAWPVNARWIGDPDSHLLDETGIPLSPNRWWVVRLLALAFASLAVIALHAPVAAVAVIGALAPSLWLRLRVAGARDRARAASADMLSAIFAAAKSGLGLAEAMRRGVAGCADPIAARPVTTALRSFELGASLDAALLEAAAATPDRRVRSALETLAVGIGERISTDRLAALLGEIADRMTFDRQLDAEIAARSSGLRMQAWLLAGVIPALAGYLALTVPTLGNALAAPFARMVLLPGAAILEIAGIVLTRQIVRGALR